MISHGGCYLKAPFFDCTMRMTISHAGSPSDWKTTIECQSSDNEKRIEAMRHGPSLPLIRTADDAKLRTVLMSTPIQSECGVPDVFQQQSQEGASMSQVCGKRPWLWDTNVAPWHRR